MGKIFLNFESNKVLNKIFNILVMAFTVIMLIFITYYFKNDVISIGWSNRVKAWFTLILLLVFAITGYFIWCLYHKRGYTYEKLFLVVAIGWGLIFQMAMPPLSGTDEAAHFQSAYFCSDKFMHTLSPEGGLQIRGEDFKFEQINCSFPEGYETITHPDGIFVTDPELKAMYPRDAVLSSWFRYIPAAIGITIARILNLNYLGVVYLGRLFNLLFWVLCGYFAIRIIPKGKAQIISCAMIPYVAELCSTYSYDTLSISLSVLLCALCLYYSQEHIKYRLVDVAILLIVCAYLAPQKIAYIPFTLMIFMIPRKKRLNALRAEKTVKSILSRVVFYLVGGVVFFFTVWKYFWVAEYTIVWKKSSESIEQYTGRDCYSMDYIVHNFKKTMSFIWNTFVNFGWGDFKLMIGASLGHHNLAVPVNESLCILIAIVALAACFIHRAKGVGKKKYIFWLVITLITLVCMILGCLMRFTPLDSGRVQVAGRYYLPIFLVGLMMTGSDANENKDTLRLLLVQNGLMIFVLYNVLEYLVYM